MCICEVVSYLCLGAMAFLSQGVELVWMGCVWYCFPGRLSMASQVLAARGVLTTAVPKLMVWLIVEYQLILNSW